MKIRFDITGIDCAHCAKELESLLAKLEGIEDLAINFPLSKLIVVTADDTDEDELLDRLRIEACKFESGIVIDFSD